MTDDKIALRALLEKGSDTTFLREMIGFAAERFMQLETDTLCGAAPGERSAERVNQRNGYRDRDWQTCQRRSKTEPSGGLGHRLKTEPRWFWLSGFGLGLWHDPALPLVA